MTPLRDHIRKNGYDYYKITGIDGVGYIYEQKDNGKTVAFEVFEHRENKHFNCVSFPGNEAFGFWAWACRTLKEADKKLDTIRLKMANKVTKP